MKKFIPFYLTILFVISLFVSYSYSTAFLPLAWNEVTLNVDGSICDDLAGYKIYYGNFSKTYTGTNLIEGKSPIIIPLSNLEDETKPSFTLSGFTPGTYYIAVTAYDSNNNESGYSNEISVNYKDLSIPASPKNLIKKEFIIK